MAQQQLSCGFSETLLQLDDNTYIRVYNRLQPQIEITTSGRKLSLSRTQWEQINHVASNIDLAFSLIGQNKIPYIPQEKRRSHDDAFDDIIESLGL